MNRISKHFLVVAGFSLTVTACRAQVQHRSAATPYLEPEIPLGSSRGIGSSSKLGIAFSLIVKEKTRTRGPSQYAVRLGDSEQRRLGLDPDNSDPIVTANVELEGGASISFANGPLKVVSRIGPFVTLRGPISQIAALAGDPGVKRVDLGGTARLSHLPHRSGVPGRILGTSRTLRHSSYTGKGVAVAVLDTGIDWSHPDFIKPDGSTRILALYDITDMSWRTSHGKVGSKPPLDDENGPMGTVYTAAQINLALRGKYKIASRDKVGHGTAVAGIAAGNGRGAPSDPAAYAGVAPEASLIIVKAGEESMADDWSSFAQWARSVAIEHKMPLAVNISAGSQYTSHDGTLVEESELDELIRSAKRGFAVVVAAGNEGEDQITATGRFDAKAPGRRDIEGKLIEVTSRPTDPSSVPPLLCFFKHSDDWGLSISADQAPFLDATGKPITVQVTQSNGKPMVAFSPTEDVGQRLKQMFARSLDLSKTEAGDDMLTVPLPAGVYRITAFGSGPKVSEGTYVFALPEGDSSFFSKGMTSRLTISSPGNAAEVITVGSYNFRNRWQSKSGPCSLNMELGALADYSSRGFRRDGLVKPDIVGPGSRQVSSLSHGSSFERESLEDGGYDIASTGKHLSWEGTSAASPYVAGVVALMLQKNPHLSSQQIRRILIASATKDSYTGAVPNPDWGFGKLDPERALAETPRAVNKR